MPSPTSYADIALDLEGLREATDRNPELLKGLETEHELLVSTMTEVQTLKARQAELTALRQETTQQLVAAVGRAREAAIRVRSIVRGKIGPKSERLVHFKVAPIRKRPRKPVEKEPDGEARGAVTPPPAKPVE